MDGSKNKGKERLQGWDIYLFFVKSAGVCNLTYCLCVCDTDTLAHLLLVVKVNFRDQWSGKTTRLPVHDVLLLLLFVLNALCESVCVRALWFKNLCSRTAGVAMHHQTFSWMNELVNFVDVKQQRIHLFLTAWKALVSGNLQSLLHDDMVISWTSPKLGAYEKDTYNEDD